ncbi:MAG: DNA-3-methyladenine glycosylase family protein [Candidatus Sumerlaeaceae bacterium]
MPSQTRIPSSTVNEALEHLSACDPVLAKVITRAGAFGLRLQSDRLEMLIRSIVSQQISTGVARAIFDRVQKLSRGEDGAFCVNKLSAASVEDLRAAGLSRQKASYVHDLAARVTDGRLNLPAIHKLSNDEVIEALTQVHGIGVWTAHMFLMFCLGRPDVFAWGDYGVRAAMRNVYGLKELPDRKKSEKIAQRWHPYATIACWYLWRSLEFQKTTD